MCILVDLGLGVRLRLGDCEDLLCLWEGEALREEVLELSLELSLSEEEEGDREYFRGEAEAFLPGDGVGEAFLVGEVFLSGEGELFFFGEGDFLGGAGESLMGEALGDGERDDFLRGPGESLLGEVLPDCLRKEGLALLRLELPLLLSLDDPELEDEEEESVLLLRPLL